MSIVPISFEGGDVFISLIWIEFPQSYSTFYLSRVYWQEILSFVPSYLGMGTVRISSKAVDEVHDLLPGDPAVLKLEFFIHQVLQLTIMDQFIFRFGNRGQRIKGK